MKKMGKIREHDEVLGTRFYLGSLDNGHGICVKFLEDDWCENDYRRVTTIKYYEDEDEFYIFTRDSIDPTLLAIRGNMLFSIEAIMKEIKEEMGID